MHNQLQDKIRNNFGLLYIKKKYFVRPRSMMIMELFTVENIKIYLPGLYRKF